MRSNADLRFPPAPSFEEEGVALLMKLIAVSVGAFIIQNLFALPLAPGQFPAGYISQAELNAGKWWTVFTHLFVHGNIMHLAINMGLLWLVGRAVAKRLGMRYFGYLFFVGGWSGTALELFLGRYADQRVLIGSSGAVFAVVAAYAVINPYGSVTDPLKRWVTFDLSVKWVVVALFLAEAVLEILSRTPLADVMPAQEVSHLCHLGGMAFGYLYTRAVSSKLATFRLVRRASPRLPRSTGQDLEDETLYMPAGQFKRRQLTKESQEPMMPPAPPAPPEPISTHELIHNAVNPILEKISEQGMESLTETEQKILGEASKRLRR